MAAADPSVLSAEERGLPTEQRLLVAAERLFATHGIGAVSLRSIMAAAEANTAAVHYHFGSKDELVAALLRDRTEEMHRRRLELIRDARDRGAPTVRDVAAQPTDQLAFLSPPAAVTVATGQTLVVEAQVALGSAASGADGLQLWICVRPSGGAIAKVHANDWLTAKAPGGTLNVYPMTDTVTGLAAGSYDVGLCGADPTPTGWNTLDQASTSYQLYGAGTAAQS